MTKNETAMILAILKTNYPSSYKGLKVSEAEAMANLWTELFADDSYMEVQNAIKAIMISDPSDFAPNIGKIKGKMYDLRQAASGGDMSAAEAWALVKQAISRGIYYSEEEFDKLPEKAQRVVGSPSQLRAWACGDENSTNTVVCSNFMRSYDALKQNEKKMAMLPQGMTIGIEARS